MIKKIFINYRNLQTRATAQNIEAALTAELGQGRIFLDLHGIPPGADWLKKLHQQVDDSEAMLVLISADWLDAKDSNAKRRLDDPNDTLVHEISRAFANDIPVVPVLIDGATMPHKSDLPDSIWQLARCQAVTLRTENIKRYTGDIAKELRRVIRDHKKRALPLRLGYWHAALAVAAAGMAGFGAMYFFSQVPVGLQSGAAKINIGQLRETQSQLRITEEALSKLRMEFSYQLDRSVQLEKKHAAELLVTRDQSQDSIATAIAQERLQHQVEIDRLKSELSRVAKEAQVNQTAEASRLRTQLSNAEADTRQLRSEKSSLEARLKKVNDRAQRLEETLRISKLGKGIPPDVSSYLRSVKIDGLSKNEQIHARSTFELAASQGDVYSVAQLARMLFKGEGGKADKSRAMLLWQQAADLGNGIAACNAGIWLGGNHVDAGVEKDPRKAAHYLLRALQLGSNDCKVYVGRDCEKHLDQPTRRAIQEVQKGSGRYGMEIDGTCSFGTLPS